MMKQVYIQVMRRSSFCTCFNKLEFVLTFGVKWKQKQIQSQAPLVF